MTIKEFFSFRQNRFFWLNILAMIIVLVAVVYGVLKGLDVYTRHGQAVTVPDIKGMSVAQAQQLLLNRGLSGVVSDSTYVKKLPAGSILDHNPSAGQRVKQGRIVYLTINTLSVPLCNVPDVADNSSLRQAEARLLAAGFRLDSIRKIPGEIDWVYSVEYKGRPLAIGEQVPVGSMLRLVVGNGEKEPELETDFLGVEDTAGAETGAPADEDEESWF